MKTEKDKLEILQSLDHFRTWRYWKSLDDQRVCILCEKKFNGHEVQITRSDKGKYELQCPTKDCNSGPHQWVYPDAPLVPDTTESESWDYSPKAEKPSRSDGDDRRATRHRSRKRRRKRKPRTARAP